MPESEDKPKPGGPDADISPDADITGSGEIGSENEAEAETLDSAYNKSFDRMNEYFHDNFVNSPKDKLDTFTGLVKHASDTQKKFFDSGTLKDQYNSYLENINFDLTDRSTDSMILVEDDLINTQVKFYYKILFLHDICRVKQKKNDGNYRYHGKNSAKPVKIKSQNNLEYLEGITDMHAAYEKFRKDPLNLVCLAEFTLAELTAATIQQKYISTIWIGSNLYKGENSLAYFHCFKKYINNNLDESERFVETNRYKIDNYDEDNNSPQTDDDIIDDDRTINEQIKLYFKLMTLYSIYDIIYNDRGDLMSPLDLLRQKILEQQSQDKLLEKNRRDLIVRQEKEKKEKEEKIRQLAKEIVPLQYIKDSNKSTRYEDEKLSKLKEEYLLLSGRNYYGGNSENARLNRKKATRKRNKSMYKQKKNSRKKLKNKKTTSKVNKTTYKQRKSATSFSAARIVRARI